MTVPGRPILVAGVALALLLLGAAVLPGLVVGVLVGDVALVLLCLAEGRLLARLGVSIERQMPPRIQINKEAEIVYRIENRSGRSLVVRVRQPCPPTLDAPSDSLEVAVAPGEVVRAALSVTPRQRGHVVLPSTEVDVRRPSALARRRWDLGDSIGVSVYPDLASLASYDALRRTRALRQLGIHRQRITGAGREFDQLRDYVPDDTFGDINWKATARHRRPITNLYQAERSQDVLLCLDCGRMMGNPVGRGTALDRAVDACIMLAHVANRQGDRVGLALFRETVQCFIKPAAGSVAVNRIVAQLVDAQPEGVFPSYAALVRALQVNQRRRGVIFLFTDLNDPQLAANMVEVLPLLSHRHVVVTVSLRDPLLERLAGGPADSRPALYEVLAARHLATEHAARRRELTKAGVQVLEADAGGLTVAAVNRYLSIKTRQMV